MAELNSAPENRQKNGRTGQRSKKLSTRIDLTPMVDLGFLLITFFLFTTTLARPRVMMLSMPAQGPPTEWRDGQTMTILLGSSHKIYYYSGAPNDPNHPVHLKTAGFGTTNNIRDIIAVRMEQINLLIAKGILPAHCNAGFIIKADSGSTYADFVDIMDELAINDVQLKTVVDIDYTDRALIAGIE